MSELELLQAEVKRLSDILDALLRLHWNERGLAKGQAGRIEKELETHFYAMLDRQRVQFTKNDV